METALARFSCCYFNLSRPASSSLFHLDLFRCVLDSGSLCWDLECSLGLGPLGVGLPVVYASCCRCSHQKVNSFSFCFLQKCSKGAALSLLPCSVCFAA